MQVRLPASNLRADSDSRTMYALAPIITGGGEKEEAQKDTGVFVGEQGKPWKPYEEQTCVGVCGSVCLPARKSTHSPINRPTGCSGIFPGSISFRRMSLNSKALSHVW